MTRFSIGDRVRVNRRRCSAPAGAVWEVVGIHRESGAVAIRSPGGFEVDVRPDLLAPAGAEVKESPATVVNWTTVALASPPEVIPFPAVRSVQREFEFDPMAEQIA